MSTQPQILVVGAGPTGLALACRCLQLGLHVRLIDQKPGPSTTSKAIGLQYRVSEMLALLGVAERFEARSARASTVNVHANGRRLLQFSFEGLGRQVGQDGYEPRALMLPQYETERLLGEFLGELGGRIEWNTAFLTHHQDREKVFAHIRRPDGSGETVEADFLVSCEGAHSLVRKQAGIEFSGKTYPLLFLLADAEMPAGLDHDQVHVWMHRDGTAAAMPLPGQNVWRWFLEVSQDTDAGEEDDEATWNRIQQAIAERVPEFRGRTPGTARWISRFRIHSRVAERYRQGRVFLAGDAAHVHSPTGGQGITTGVQDAMNLAWKLARVLRGAPAELLDTYEEERRPHALEVLRETGRTTSLMYATRPPVTWFRDWVLLPLLRQKWMQRLMFGRFAQLHVTYHGCRLARSKRRRWFGVRCGDRAPDVALCTAAGRVVTLLDLLRPGKPVLLLGMPARGGLELAADLRLRGIAVFNVVGKDSRDVPPEEGLADHHGDLRRLYGLAGEFACLIRPDGHVGLIHDETDPRGLREYAALLGATPDSEQVLHTSAPSPTISEEPGVLQSISRREVNDEAETAEEPVAGRPVHGPGAGAPHPAPGDGMFPGR